MADYIMTMHKIGKFIPPDRDLIKDITLSFMHGAKIGVLGPERRWQVDAAQDHGRHRYRLQRRTSTHAGQHGWHAHARAPTRRNQETSTTTSSMASAMSPSYSSSTTRYLLAGLIPRRDYDKLGTRQAAIEKELDAKEGWDVKRTIEIAMDALRTPPAEAEVTTLSGGEKRRVCAGSPAALQA